VRPGELAEATPSPARRAARHWPAWLAALAIGVVYLVTADRLTVGPSWLPLGVILVGIVPATWARLRGRHQLARGLALAVLIALTAVIAISAFFLVSTLTHQGTRAGTLLFDAALIWLANVALFALWYWEVDCGGPMARHHHGYRSTDFIFPQATLPDQQPAWSPRFIDYLFLAFNTSTAFSPTDTLVLSGHAKVLMMAQSLISLVVIAVLAARAINTI
jgi:uncharacterized membrane protein